ncbi:MAG: NADH-quinone oxidoreductase subunit NuoK [Chloroflexi bacterium]|nr:NADH-quinone oxidoreductase subunit NuoK [Chloroflexota bacterium]
MSLSSLHYFILSAILFAIGGIGVLVRRNVFVIFMCVEMMLNAVNLSLIAFARYLNAPDGQLLVLFVMAIAAAEVVVGLAILVALYRKRPTTDVDEMNVLRG